MSKGRGIALRITLVLVFASTISFLFGCSLYLGFLIVAILGAVGEVIHLPENMPGGADNPEGKDLHPYMGIAIGLMVVLVLLGLGHIFPSLYSYGLGSYS